VIDEVAKDLRLNVMSRPVMVAPPMSSGQRDIAKSLLKLVEALERVARNNPVRESPSDQGAKIV